MEGVIDKYLKCTGGHRGSSSATFTSQEQFQPPNLVRLSPLFHFNSLFPCVLIKLFSLSFGINF